jgi:hypothetical protein
LINSDAIEPIVELATIVALMVFVYRGGWGSARALWVGRRDIAMEVRAAQNGLRKRRARWAS